MSLVQLPMQPGLFQLDYRKCNGQLGSLARVELRVPLSRSRQIEGCVQRKKVPSKKSEEKQRKSGTQGKLSHEKRATNADSVQKSRPDLFIFIKGLRSAQATIRYVILLKSRGSHVTWLGRPCLFSH